MNSPRSTILESMKELPFWYHKDVWAGVPLPASRMKYKLHNPIGPCWYKSHHLIPLSQTRPTARPPTVFSSSFPPITASTSKERLEDPTMERPSSEGMSIMSSTIDDTFLFIRRQSRRRVESDASSFYFKAPLSGSHNHGHRRYESNMSVTHLMPHLSACTTAALALTGTTTLPQVHNRLLFHILVTC